MPDMNSDIEDRWEADVKEARKECNICGRLWPHHEFACSYMIDAANLSKIRVAAIDVIAEYDKWAEDANDGEFALYKEDDIHTAILNLRRAVQRGR